MMNGRPMIWIAWLGLTFVVPPVIAQPLASAPDYKVGDRWKYRRTVTASPQEGQTLNREVLGIEPNGRISIRRGNGTTYEIDAAGNFLDPRGSDFDRVDFKFPLHVGDEWTFRRHHGGTPSIWEERGTVKVVGFEPITVPAGKLDCFKLVREYSSSFKLISEQNHTISWYCPAVKVSAREEWTNRTWNPYSGGQHRRLSPSLN